MEKRKLVTPDDITTALRDIGVQKGQVIMVHTSMSSLGYVCGGTQSVIEALVRSVGEEGTIMMPTQSWKNLDPAAGVYWQEPEEWWPVIREGSFLTFCIKRFQQIRFGAGLILHQIKQVKRFIF